MPNADSPVTLSSGCLSTHIKSLCSVPNHSQCKQQNESLQENFFGINRCEDITSHSIFFLLHNPSCNESFKLYFFRIYGIFKNLFLFIYYWSIVDLQCGVSFWYTAKWSSYTHTHTHAMHLYMYIYVYILFHYGLL